MAAQPQPIPVSQVLSTSLAMYSRNAMTLAKCVLPVVVPFAILGTLLTWLTSPDFFSSTFDFRGQRGFDPNTFDNDRLGQARSDLNNDPGSLLSGVGTLLAEILAIGAIAAIAAGRSVDWRENLREHAPRAIPALGVGLIVLLGFLLLGVISAATLGLGVFIAVPLGIWAAVSLAPALAVVVLERAGPVEAIRRSVFLVRGNWWRVFGVLILFLLLLFAVSLALGLVLVIGGLAFRESPAAIAVVMTLFNILFTAILGPLFAALVTGLYYYLRAAHGESGTPGDAAASATGASAVPSPPGATPVSDARSGGPAPPAGGHSVPPSYAQWAGSPRPNSPDNAPRPGGHSEAGSDPVFDALRSRPPADERDWDRPSEGPMWSDPHRPDEPGRRPDPPVRPTESGHEPPDDRGDGRHRGFDPPVPPR